MHPRSLLICKAMKVKIISSQKTTFWYADKIGQEFYVEDHDYRSYQIFPDGHFIRIIDCEILSLTEMGVSEVLIPPRILDILNKRILPIIPR